MGLAHLSQWENLHSRPLCVQDETSDIIPYVAASTISPLRWAVLPRPLPGSVPFSGSGSAGGRVKKSSQRCLSRERNLRQWADYKCESSTTEDPSSTCWRTSYSEQFSHHLCEWYSNCQRLGARHEPGSGGLHEARAKRIASKQGVIDMKGSCHFVKI